MNIRRLTIVSIILIVFCVFVVSTFLWNSVYLPKNPGLTQKVSFTIERGEGAKQIAVNLERAGLIRSSSIFRVYASATGASKNLQAGQYLLSPDMNTPEIIDLLVSGQVLKKKITILEGWDLNEIWAYLKENEIGSKENFFGLVGQPVSGYPSASVKDFSQEFSFLKDKPKSSNLEGYLFPDTYEVLASDSLEAVIRKILDHFDKKMTPDLKSEIAKQNKSIFEIITMASLIEKEVRIFEDKKTVSGVLWKRLEIGMPLQVDASIIYITGRDMTREQTYINSPYNTYKNKGLPPGPISNPGLESILAAVYPTESNYLYYLSTPSGKTIFSRTLEEHNIARNKYLK